MKINIKFILVALLTCFSSFVVASEAGESEFVIGSPLAQTGEIWNQKYVSMTLILENGRTESVGVRVNEPLNLDEVCSEIIDTDSYDLCIYPDFMDSVEVCAPRMTVSANQLKNGFVMPTTLEYGKEVSFDVIGQTSGSRHPLTVTMYNLDGVEMMSRLLRFRDGKYSSLFFYDDYKYTVKLTEPEWITDSRLTLVNEEVFGKKVRDGDVVKCKYTPPKRLVIRPQFNNTLDESDFTFGSLVFSVEWIKGVRSMVSLYHYNEVMNLPMSVGVVTKKSVKEILLAPADRLEDFIIKDFTMKNSKKMIEVTVFIDRVKRNICTLVIKDNTPLAVCVFKKHGKPIFVNAQTNTSYEMPKGKYRLLTWAPYHMLEKYNIDIDGKDVRKNIRMKKCPTIDVRVLAEDGTAAPYGAALAGTDAWKHVKELYPKNHVFKVPVDDGRRMQVLFYPRKEGLPRFTLPRHALRESGIVKVPAARTITVDAQLDAALVAAIMALYTDTGFGAARIADRDRGSLPNTSLALVNAQGIPVAAIERFVNGESYEMLCPVDDGTYRLVLIWEQMQMTLGTLGKHARNEHKIIEVSLKKFEDEKHKREY